LPDNFESSLESVPESPVDPSSLPEHIRGLLDEDAEIVVQIDGVGDDVSSGSLSSTSDEDADSDSKKSFLIKISINRFSRTYRRASA